MKPFVLVIAFMLSLPVGSTQTFNEQQLLQQFDRLYNQPFPQLQLEDANGALFNTTSLHGKTLYVDFWFTQCPPCLKEIPFADTLKKTFANDTNVVFLNICIENIERKEAWKQVVKEKQIGGVNLFYARNRPQKVNLLREYKVENFPTYMLVNSDMKIIGHNAPAPSDAGLVEWSLFAATQNIALSRAYLLWRNNAKKVQEFLSRLKK